MYEQITIFDTIEQPKTLLEKLFTKSDNPVCACRNCLCNFCGNNCEEKTNKDATLYCYNCDECSEYDGKMRILRKCEDCSEFVMSDAKAKEIRSKFKSVQTGRRNR